MSTGIKKAIRVLSSAMMLMLLASCAGQAHFKDAQSLLNQGRLEDGLSELAKAVDEDPGNVAFRQEYLVRREQVINQILAIAERASQAGEWSKAEEAYQRVLALDAHNERAQTGLELIAQSKRHMELIKQSRVALKAGDADKALTLVQSVLSENPDHVEGLALKREIMERQVQSQMMMPTLKHAYAKPISLEFRDANVKLVFEALSRTSGINFILDKDVRPDLRTTVYLRNSSIDDALDLIAQTSQLQLKILNANTVLVYPNTPEKLKDYQDLIVRGFYLRSASAKDIQNNLKTLLKAKDMVVDEKLNLIVMRDTPETIQLAERIIAMHDIPEPEIMLEVAVLEVQRNHLTALGVQWPSQVALTPLSAGTGLTVNDLRNINSSRIGVGISNVLVNLQNTVTDADILANPRIRARNHEKAKILIGDKLPIVTTTTTATGLVSDNIQYIDVGLKLDIEPEVRLNSDVAIKIALEVSSVTNQVTTPSGSVAYQIGTRNANTSLLLHDGETEVLAGLISTQEHSGGSSVPGLGSIPILDRLFGSKKDENDKTEIVLSITPHVIRNLKRPEAPDTEFWSGSESNLKSKPLGQTQQAAGATQNASDSSQSTPNSVLANATQPEVAANSVALNWQGPAKLKVGEEVKLALKIKSDGGIRGLPLQISVDPKVFQITEVAEGNFFNQNNGTSSFSKNIDAASGKAFISVARSDVSGASGEGTAITIGLRALTESPSSEVHILQASTIVQSDRQPSLSFPSALSMTVAP
jgi:general secretion pathway protein D